MEGNMKFIYQFDENSPKVEITLSPESTITDALEGFEAFLRAAGYCFDGVVDIVNENEESENVTA